MDYESYLQLSTLLSAQKPVSEAKGRTAHDEMLFICVHHTYEIWFKQILFELDSILKIFARDTIEETEMDTIVSRLARINEIFKVLVGQVDVLETMTPMNFLEFRDLVYSASGFQSYQFRLLENKLGLRAADRLSSSQPYYAALSSEQAALIQKCEAEPSLYDCIEKWLGRTPFLDMPGFQFWERYQEAANLMFDQDESFIESSSHASPEEKLQLSKQIVDSRKLFSTLFDKNLYDEVRKQGGWRLSYRAVHAALLIQVYRDQPIFQLPFRLISEVLNLDSHLTQWRYRHMIMAKRTLGSRVGTGASSGAKYLRDSVDRHKIFEDFYKLTTFFIPRNRLPELPADFKEQLGFNFRGQIREPRIDISKDNT